MMRIHYENDPPVPVDTDAEFGDRGDYDDGRLVVLVLPRWVWVYAGLALGGALILIHEWMR